ncbi:MAG TPA: cysteine desulfurase family protein [Planctomycetota bacterium]|jgi:cysteine desulfurase
MRYFDYAASAPPYPQALETFSRVSVEAYANPSASHALGAAARRKLAENKVELCTLCGFAPASQFQTLNPDPRPLNPAVLTSSGTEANNLAIRGVMEAQPDARSLVAEDVHASAWFAVDRYRSRADVLPLGRGGKIDPAGIEKKLTKRHALCSVVHACNETGIVHDIAALGEICRRKNVLLHVDGAQALGHLPLRLADLPVDFYTFSAHKFGAPRGVGGVLFFLNPPLRILNPFRSSVNSVTSVTSVAHPLVPQILGGGQEGGLRSGTENVAGLAAAVTALKLSLEAMPSETKRLRELAGVLAEKIRSGVPDALLNSDLENGLAGLVSLSFAGTVGQALVAELSLRQMAVGTGAACHSNQVEPSRAILALGRSKAEALGTVRISMGRDTTATDVDDLARALIEIVARQRALA